MMVSACCICRDSLLSAGAADTADDDNSDILVDDAAVLGMAMFGTAAGEGATAADLSVVAADTVPWPATFNLDGVVISDKVSPQ